MNALPFAINSGAVPGPGVLNVRVELVGSVHESKYQLPVLLSPIRALADLGGVGGLAGDRFPPRESALNLLNSGQAGETSLYWSLRYKDVDRRAINVLTNILHFAHVRISPVRQVWIAAPRDLLGGRNTEELPPVFKPLPFAFSDLREEPEPTFTIEVVFPQEHPEEVLRSVEDAFGKWFTAASNGAFASPNYSPDLCKVYLGDEPVYDNDKLILYVEDMVMSHEEALASLLNVFQWVHAHIAKIAEIQFML